MSSHWRLSHVLGLPCCLPGGCSQGFPPAVGFVSIQNKRTLILALLLLISECKSVCDISQNNWWQWRIKATVFQRLQKVKCQDFQSADFEVQNAKKKKLMFIFSEWIIGWILRLCVISYLMRTWVTCLGKLKNVHVEMLLNLKSMKTYKKEASCMRRKTLGGIIHRDI